MTITPDYAPPPRSRRWSVSEILSWSLIIGAVVTAVVYNVSYRTRSPSTADTRGSTITLITARYLVGAKHLLPVQPKDLLPTVDSLEKNAEPVDRFHSAMLRGEVQGREQGRERLNSCAGVYAWWMKDVILLDRWNQNTETLDSPEIKDFRQRHGWFADLALSQGRPDTDPLRASTLNAAIRTLAAILAFALAAGITGLAGLVLAIIGLVMFARRRLVPAFATHLPTDRRSYVQGFAIYLVAMFAASVLLTLFPLRNSLGVPTSLLLMPLPFALALIWPLIRGQSRLQWQHATGLHTGKGVLREIASGLAGYAAGLPLIGVGMLITLILTRLTHTQATHPIINEVTAGTPRMLLWLFLASIWAPITEELMFRGLLFAHLRERYGFWISAAAVAFIFAIIHPQGWAALPALGAIALVLAGIREWRGSIIGPITAHSLNNTAVMLMLIAAVS